MDGLSSPGPYGFPVAFHKKHWPLIGAQVSEAILSVLNSNGILTEVNTTFISFIPKKKNPLE